jgi:hypothetical protein
MNTMVMNMDECNIEREAPMNEEYSEEVMCAGWNPQLALVAESPVARINKHVTLPDDLAYVDIDAFLKRMYEYQC